MVTVVDPNGTPSPIYTRSGTTIDTVIPAGTTQGTATPIVTVCGRSIIVCPNYVAENAGVILPSSVDIGDVVEFYYEGYPVKIYPDSGSQINTHGSDVPIQPGGNGNILIRKITSDQWRTIPDV